MTLLTPLALVLLALLPPIIALYLLKLRRQDHVVSSTYLWQRFVRDVEANAPWQKLRRNLLLLLQLLFMLLLILALARPATQAEGVVGQTVVLILDTSASMAATDGEDNGRTRLDATKAAARELIVNLPDQTRVTLMAAAGGEVDTLVSASQDRRQALDVLTAVQPTALNSDLAPALALAEAIVARETGAEIILLSDGVVQLPERLTVPLHFISVGKSDANQAISALSVTFGPGGTVTLFVQASNYSNQPVQRRLTLLVDGAPFTAFDLDLPPGGHVEQLVENLPASAQTVEVALNQTQTDVLPLDDQAWLVVHPAEPVAATLITSGNFFLQTALNLLGSQQSGTNFTLTVITPEDWQTNPPPSTLHIFDSYTPDSLPPGNLLFIAPPASIPGLFEVLGQAANPTIQSIQADPPLLQNVDLSTTQILTTTVLSPTTWGRAIVSAATQSSNPPTLQPSNLPILLAGENEGRRIAALAFSLQHSDLPLRPAFPILVANLFSYLSPGTGVLVPPLLGVGESVSVSVPAQIERLRLMTPDGAETTLAPAAGRVTLPPTDQPGLYTLNLESAGGEVASTRFAVNFFNPLESNIAPHPELKLTTPAEANTTPASLPPAHQEWWRPLALGALILLVVEWLVYQRSKLFRYWTLLRKT
ncbi:MAG: BatA domain-containing protein [Anaerolineae bacterium]|nr:BatA domain-containing protein [Anaerolineae bacterium]